MAPPDVGAVWSSAADVRPATRARPVTASSSNLDGVDMRMRCTPGHEDTGLRDRRNRRGSHEVAGVQGGDRLGLAGGEAQPGEAGPPAVVHVALERLDSLPPPRDRVRRRLTGCQ